MKRALLTLAVGMTAWVVAVRAELPAPAKAVVDAERAFSAAAAAKGQRDAFLEFLADDSLLFRPGPVPGKMFYRTRPVPPGLLSWAPVFVDVSADADMALSTGPYEFRKDEKAPTSEPTGYGHFVSIWRKQKDGSWKVEVDLGTAHDKYSKAVSAITATEVETLKTPPKAPAAKAGTDLTQTLTDADKALAAAATKDGIVKAYEAAVLDEVRILRNGQLPIIGKAGMAKALGVAPVAAGASAPAAPTWEPVHTRVSSSGDFGYTTGAIGAASSAAPMGGSAPQRQYYLHVWRRDASGAWKLLLDVVP